MCNFWLLQQQATYTTHGHTMHMQTLQQWHRVYRWRLSTADRIAQTQSIVQRMLNLELYSPAPSSKRAPPMASTSSKKMRHAFLLLAIWNSSRTIRAPSPTYFCTSSLPMTLMKQASVLLATARASRVLPASHAAHECALQHDVQGMCYMWLQCTSIADKGVQWSQHRCMQQAFCHMQLLGPHLQLALWIEADLHVPKHGCANNALYTTPLSDVVSMTSATGLTACMKQ